MLEPILTASPDNWDIAYTDTKIATVISASSHLAIEAWDVPIIFDNHVLAVNCSIPDTPSAWRYGVQLRPILIDGYLPIPDLEFSAITVPPNRARLCVFPRVTNQYKLRIKPAPWHKQVDITIFQYTGEYTDRVEALINSQFSGVNLKLDTIDGKLSS